MNKSESIKNIAAAMARFQAEIKDPRKEANNPFFKSKYVTLDALVDCMRPVLAKHGLSYIQSPSGDGQNISITTLVLHESGEWIESDPFVMKAAKTDPQGAGSAVTYGRRYSLQAVFGITWCDKDDDGNNSSLVTVIDNLKKKIEKSGIPLEDILRGYGIGSLDNITDVRAAIISKAVDIKMEARKKKQNGNC